MHGVLGCNPDVIYLNFKKVFNLLSHDPNIYETIKSFCIEQAHVTTQNNLKNWGIAGKLVGLGELDQKSSIVSNDYWAWLSDSSYVKFVIHRSVPFPQLATSQFLKDTNWLELM